MSIEISHISRSFENQQVLQDISFRVDARGSGRFSQGPNGRVKPPPCILAGALDYQGMQLFAAWKWLITPSETKEKCRLPARTKSVLICMYCEGIHNFRG